MRRVRVVCLLVLLSLPLSLAAQTATSKMVSAANRFLAALNEKQRQAVQFSFNDEEQRKRWSNFPVMMVRRGGISLKDMNSVQREDAMALVAAALSPKGFEKVQRTAAWQWRSAAG